jgi:energy-converting hydrogenase Eha subunit H
LAVVSQTITELDAAYQRAEAKAQANQAAADKYRAIRAIAIVAALVAGGVAVKRVFF